MTVRVYQVTGQVLYTLFDGTAGVAESEMALSQEVSFQTLPSGIIFFDAGLALEQEVDVFGLITMPPEDTEMALTQTVVASYPKRPTTLDKFGLEQEVDWRYGTRNISVEHVMGLTQDLRLSVPISVETVMGLTNEASRHTLPVDEELNLQSEVDWGYGKDAITELGLVEILEFDQILNKSGDANMGLEQAVAWFMESPCIRKQFQSFHGSGGVAPAQPKLNYTNTFLIQSIDDGTIVELRNPEMDNRRRYAFNRVNRTFFDGTPDIYSDDSWITEQTQIYTIIALKRDDLDTLFTFLLDNLGREVLVKDWKGVTWIVIITNPGEVYTEDGEGRWTIEFEVVGEPIDGEFVVNQMRLDDDLSRAGSIYTRLAESADGLTQHSFPQPLPIDSGMGMVGAASFTVETP